MKTLIRPALSLFLLLSLITGLIYPGLVTAFAQLLFPIEANGSLIRSGDRTVGSSLIGQPFESAGLFWGRPSATGPFPYNAAASSGSNLGPSNPLLRQAVEQRIAALRAAHPEQKGPVPLDLVTTSASGLDPHISPAAAHYQVPRVAKALGLEEAVLRELVVVNTEGPQWGLLGMPRVNVLRLNIAVKGLEIPTPIKPDIP